MWDGTGRPLQSELGDKVVSKEGPTIELLTHPSTSKAREGLSAVVRGYLPSALRLISASEMVCVMSPERAVMVRGLNAVTQAFPVEDYGVTIATRVRRCRDKQPRALLDMGRPACDRVKARNILGKRRDFTGEPGETGCPWAGRRRYERDE